MPYTEQDLLDAEVERHLAETRTIGKQPWHSPTYWIAIITALLAVSSTVMQYFRSDIEYKLAKTQEIEANNLKAGYVKDVAALKQAESELKRNRDAIGADINSRKEQLAALTATISALQADLSRIKSELATNNQELAAISKAQRDASVAAQAVEDLNRWFVYLTSDDDVDAESYARKEKPRLEVDLRNHQFSEPVTLVRKNNRWCLAVGEVVPEDKAQELVNRLYKAGYKQASSSLISGWTIVKK